MKTPLASTLCRAGLALAVATTAAAQQQPFRPPSLEFDAFAGYTAVDADKWSGFTSVSDANHLGFGAAARYMFLNISGVRMGVEVGTQQLFTWEIESTVGTSIVRRKSTVAGFHFLPTVRMAEGARGSVDVGFGFHFLGDDAVPGLLVNTNYAVVRTPRLSIPIGARVNIVLNDPVSAMNVALRAGVAIPLQQ